MGDGRGVWFANPIHPLLQSSRAATTYDAQSNGRRMPLACAIFEVLTNSAFLIRRAVMRYFITTWLGKQCGVISAIGMQQSLRSTPIERSQP
jgi:hypothetical protein